MEAEKSTASNNFALAWFIKVRAQDPKDGSGMPLSGMPYAGMPMRACQ